MKIIASLLAAFGLLASVASAQDVPPLPLTFEQVLALPKGRAIVYAPVRVVEGQSVGVHAITMMPLALRPHGGARGVQIIYFAVKPADSSVEAIAYDTIPASAAGAGSGGGAGKVSMRDIHYTKASPQFVFADGSVRFIPVVVGYDIVRDGMPAKPFPLPKELALLVQLESTAILPALLLPAVQKVR